MPGGVLTATNSHPGAGRAPPRVVVAATALVIVLAFGLFAWWSQASAQSNATTFDTGSLIIPMDTGAGTASGSAAYNQDRGMWKAYGLVYRLLQNGIPVHWAIMQGKSATDQTDASVSSVTDLRTGTSLGSWDYKGGPFIIDSADAAAADPIIRAWWAANANQPNVHVAQEPFTADVNVTLTKAPLIAEESINANIAIAYFNAAGSRT